jgi:hypothetical protein
MQIRLEALESLLNGYASDRFFFKRRLNPFLVMFRRLKKLMVDVASMSRCASNREHTLLNSNKSLYSNTTASDEKVHVVFSFKRGSRTFRTWS